MTQSEIQPRRGHVGVYYFLALGIAWAGWIPYGAQQAGILHWQIPQEIPMLAQHSPLFAASMLVAAEG